MSPAVLLFLLSISTSLIICVSSSLVTLNDGNFYSETQRQNHFVVFTLKHRVSLFDSFWEDVSNLYNDDPDEDFYCAQVSCVDSPKLCKTANIRQPLEIRFYPKTNSDFDPAHVKGFIQGIIDKYLKEWEPQRKMIEKLESGKFVLLMSKPKCPNCMEFKPIWNELVKRHKNESRYTLMNINCPDYEEICDHYQVEQYPVVAFSDKYANFKVYNGKDHLTSLSLFVRRAARDKAKKLVQYESGLLQLDGDTIFNVLEKDLTFVQFELPGCHYCDEHNETMHRLARYFASDPTIKVAKMDCGKTLALCQELNAKIYPLFNVYRSNNLVKRDYHETMTFEGFRDCIKAFKVGGYHLKKWKWNEKQKRRVRKLREKEEIRREQEERDERLKKRKNVNY